MSGPQSILAKNLAVVRICLVFLCEAQRIVAGVLVVEDHAFYVCLKLLAQVWKSRKRLRPLKPLPRKGRKESLWLVEHGQCLRM